MNFQKRVLIAGTGKSGINAGKLLLKKGAEIVFYDDNASLDVEELLKQFDDEYGIRVILGEINDTILADIDLMVISPGIPVDSKIANTIRDKGIPIWSGLNLLIRREKEGLQQLPEQTERQQQLLWLVKFLRIIQKTVLRWEILEFRIRK